MTIIFNLLICQEENYKNLKLFDFKRIIVPTLIDAKERFQR